MKPTSLLISFSATLLYILSVLSEMFKKWRSKVPEVWVLVGFVTIIDSCVQAYQFWNSDHQLYHIVVILVDRSVNKFFLLTIVQSCYCPGR